MGRFLRTPYATTTAGVVTASQRPACLGTRIGIPPHETRIHTNHAATIAANANGVKML